MNNRLQVGGLALVIADTTNHKNEGKVVRLLSYHEKADCLGVNGEYIRYDQWEVSCDSGIICYDGNILYDGGVAYHSSSLMPLGDDAAIELYKLKEELTCNN